MFDVTPGFYVVMGGFIATPSPHCQGQSTFNVEFEVDPKSGAARTLSREEEECNR
jgi:hypothetical protein